jgi:hypothetical protein
MASDKAMAMNINQASVAIAEILERFETSEGVIVDSVDIEDLSVTQIGSSDVEILRNVRIRYSRPKVRRWK